MMTAAARIMSGNWNGGLRWWFAECLSSLYINTVTSEALENNANDPTSQKGMPLDMCNSEWAREPVAMRIFMRESSRSTPQENCKAAKPVCDYLSNSRARLQTNSATRVVMMWSASATYCNKYWVETLHLHARYTQRQCSLQMAAIVSTSGTCLMRTSLSTNGICIMNATLSAMFSTRLATTVFHT